MAVALPSCGGGGGGSQFSDESAGRFPVEVVAAKFPARQQLDQNAYLRIGVRNRGRKTLPAMAVTITIGGKKGVESTQPFSIRDPQPGLASPDRPVWILADTYPRIARVPGPGGSQTSNNKTFDFGRLAPGDARVAVWKLGAVKAGAYKLRYRIDAGLSGQQEAVNADGGGPPVGSFAVRIASQAAADQDQLQGADRPGRIRRRQRRRRDGQRGDRRIGKRRQPERDLGELQRRRLLPAFRLAAPVGLG